MSSIKILHLVDSPHTGGIETWLLELLKSVPREYAELDVCFKGSDTGALVNEFRDTSAKLHFCKLKYNPIGFAFRLARILREGSYDVLHSHQNLHAGAAALAGRLAKVPVIASIHSSRPVRATDVEKHPFIVRRASSYYARSSWSVARRYTRLFAPVSKGVAKARFGPDVGQIESVQVFYLGVKEPKKIDDQQTVRLKTQLGVAHDTPLVLHAGSFTDQKNHAGLIKVFVHVKEKEPNAKLILAGDGPLRSDIEQKIKENDLTDQVLLLGFRNDVTDLMQACDVFLMPSLYEGLPLALVEAAACRLPIVASNIAGIDEAVIHGSSGFLHNVDDYERMSDSVAALLHDQVLGEKVSQNARQFYENCFSMPRHIERLTELYTSIVTPDKSTVRDRQVDKFDLPG